MPEIVLDDLCKDFDGHVAARSYTELRTVTNRFTHVLQATLTPWN